MSFRKLRGVALPEEKQGLIRYTCLTYQEQPRWVREKIDRLCRECGGEHAKALHAVLCTRESMTAIAMRHHVSESVLYERRKAFYESWYKKR